MLHASFDANCRMCTRLAADEQPVFENDLWHVRPISAPCAVPGWMLLVARRHVAGPAQFDAREAQSFGPMWCHLQRVLLEVTGALRIYTAALGESLPHFHGHMVPRLAQMPKAAKGWDVFDLERAARAGEVEADAGECARVRLAFEQALRRDPPPAA